MDVINIGLQEFVKELSCLLSKLFAVSFSGIALDSTLVARNPQAFVVILFFPASWRGRFLWVYFDESSPPYPRPDIRQD